MALLKKLSIAITLALGIQLNTQTYDATKLKSEVQVILEFAVSLDKNDIKKDSAIQRIKEKVFPTNRQESDKEIYFAPSTIGQWLKVTIMNSYTSNDEITVIASIINSRSFTKAEKLSLLTNKMETQIVSLWLCAAGIAITYTLLIATWEQLSPLFNNKTHLAKIN